MSGGQWVRALPIWVGVVVGSAGVVIIGWLIFDEFGLRPLALIFGIVLVIAAVSVIAIGASKQPGHVLAYGDSPLLGRYISRMRSRTRGSTARQRSRRDR